MKTIAELTRDLLEARRERDAIRERQKLEMAPVSERLYECEQELQRVFTEQGLNSAPNEYGTPYRSVIRKYSIKEWDEFIEFVRANDLYHMLERRVSKSSVDEYVEGQGDLPPGVAVNAELRINVRKA